MEVLKRNFTLLCNLYLSSCCYLKCVGQLPNWKSLIFFSLSPLNPFLPQGFCTPCFLFLNTLSSQILIRRDPWNLFLASLNVTSSEKPSQTFQAHAMLSLAFWQPFSVTKNIQPIPQSTLLWQHFPLPGRDCNTTLPFLPLDLTLSIVSSCSPEIQPKLPASPDRPTFLHSAYHYP